jgi:hypothetical protein
MIKSSKPCAARMMITAILVVMVSSTVTATTAVGRDYTVPAGITEKEVAVSLGDLTVEGVVTGSAKVSGGNARVRGQVGKNLTVSLGDAMVEGRVGGEVVVKQGDLIVSGEVGNGVSVALGDTTVSGKVKGSVRIQNGDLTLKGGSIDGDVEVVLGNVILEGGAITGSLTVKGGRVQGDIRIVRGTTSVSEIGGVAGIRLEGLEDLPKKLEKIGEAIALPAGLLAILLLIILSIVFFVIAFGLVMAMLYIVRIPTARAGSFLKKGELLTTFLSGLFGGFVLVASIAILAATIVFIPVAVFFACLAVVGMVFGFAVLAIVVGRAIFSDLLKWHLPDWLFTMLGFLLLFGFLIVPGLNKLALLAYFVFSLGVTLRVIFGRKQNLGTVITEPTGEVGPAGNVSPATPGSSAGKPDRDSLPTGDTQGGDATL